MSPRPPPASSHPSNVASAEVRAAIVAALHRQHVQRGDIEDLTQDVIVKALALREPPATLPECTALVHKMATELAIDRMRRQRVRGRFNAGACENPDDRAPEPAPADAREAIDVRRQLEFARRQVEIGLVTARQAAILESDADDVPQPEIARRLDIAYQTARNDLARGRRTLRDGWAAYVAMALFTIAGFIVWALRDRTQLANDDRTVPDPRPDHSLAPPEPTPGEMASGLRRQALHACAAQQWLSCLGDLELAASLDPEGDQKPWVQKARREALSHLDAKPRFQ